MRINGRALLLPAVTLAICSLGATPAVADNNGVGKGPVTSGEFVQTDFDNGGEIRVKFWGRDLDGDGVLYSMSGFLAANILDSNGAPLSPGNELIRIEMSFVNFLGIPYFQQVFDERETPMDLTPAFSSTAFMGFAYNLDGGKFGDDANEGISLGPLAPSVWYAMGPLFGNILFPGQPQLGPCGLGGTSLCAAVTQLGFNETGLAVLTANYANSEIHVHKGKGKIGSKPCKHH